MGATSLKAASFTGSLYWQRTRCLGGSAHTNTNEMCGLPIKGQLLRRPPLHDRTAHVPPRRSCGPCPAPPPPPAAADTAPAPDVQPPAPPRLLGRTPAARSRPAGSRQKPAGAAPAARRRGSRLARSGAPAARCNDSRRKSGISWCETNLDASWLRVGGDGDNTRVRPDLVSQQDAQPGLNRNVAAAWLCTLPKNR